MAVWPKTKSKIKVSDITLKDSGFGVDMMDNVLVVQM